MQRFRPEMPGLDRKLLRFDRKEIKCVLTNLIATNHEIKLADKEKVPLGRSQTLDPENNGIPEVQFYCTAHVSIKTLYAVLVDGEGFYNDQRMIPQQVYELHEGDILAFTDDELHCYQVSFIMTDFKWPGPLAAELS